MSIIPTSFFFFFQAEDGIRDKLVTGVQTCALPIYSPSNSTIVGGFTTEHSAQHEHVDSPGPGTHCQWGTAWWRTRSEEHTSELQSLAYLVCRLLLEKKKKKKV